MNWVPTCALYLKPKDGVEDQEKDQLTRERDAARAEAALLRAALVSLNLHGVKHNYCVCDPTGSGPHLEPCASVREALAASPSDTLDALLELMVWLESTPEASDFAHDPRLAWLRRT